MTQTDVVLVQIEYRLGPLGFASFDGESVATGGMKGQLV